MVSLKLGPAVATTIISHYHPSLSGNLHGVTSTQPSWKMKLWDSLFPQQVLGLLTSPPLEISQNPFHLVATRDGCPEMAGP